MAAPLSRAGGKTNQIKFTSNVKLYHFLFVNTISLCQNLLNVMDSSKPLIGIFSIAISGQGIFPPQDLRFQSDSQVICLAILIIMQMSALPEG